MSLYDTTKSNHPGLILSMSMDGPATNNQIFISSSTWFDAFYNESDLNHSLQLEIALQLEKSCRAYILGWRILLVLVNIKFFQFTWT